MADDDDIRRLFPWIDVLKRERRKMLLEHLLFERGVTTVPGPSGGGKTSFGIAIAMAVGSIGEKPAMWGGKPVQQRPVIWDAAEGQDDIRPMIEAWKLRNPERELPQGGFFTEAFDLTFESEADELIKYAKSLNAPPLIVLDALTDVIGDSDADKARDMSRVYRHIWKVVKKADASVFIPHHAGWDKDRERGSTVIRAKSDIVPFVNKFDPKAGIIELKHNKRRGGAKLDSFAYGVELVTVPGYPEPVPLVTGKLAQSKLDLSQPFRRSPNAQAGFVVLGIQFPRGAEWNEWFAAWGTKQKDTGGPASKATFNRVIQELSLGSNPDVIKQGEGEGAIWRVNPTTWASEMAAQSHSSGLTEPVSSQVPLQGPETAETGSTSLEPVSNQSHETGQSEVERAAEASCKTDPAEAERWRAMRDYEEQISRERTAKATGTKPGDIAKEAMEHLQKRKV
jgi:hypothetical protein